MQGPILKTLFFPLFSFFPFFFSRKIAASSKRRSPSPFLSPLAEGWGHKPNIRSLCGGLVGCRPLRITPLFLFFFYGRGRDPQKRVYMACLGAVPTAHNSSPSFFFLSFFFFFFFFLFPFLAQKLISSSKNHDRGGAKKLGCPSRYVPFLLFFFFSFLSQGQQTG